MSEQNYWTRTAGRRLSRRGMLRGTAVAGLGLAGAALIGCGDDDDEEAAPAAAATTAAAAAGTPAAAAATEAAGPEVYGGTFRTPYVQTLAYQHIDPHPAVWTAGFTWATHSPLARINRSNPDTSTWELEPDLASSWEQPDDTSYVFHLADANFHDIAPVSGRLVTSEDVKYMFTHMSTEEPQFFRQHEFADATIETPDEKTVVVKFPTPQAPFWNRLTTAGSVVLPVEVADIEGVLITSGKPLAGTGPFMHDEWVVDSHQIEVRNPNYFKPDLPYLDKIDGAFYPNRDAQMVAFRAKQIDYVTSLTAEYYDEAQGMENVELDTRVGVCCPTWTQFNLLKAPFDDVRVRRAISLAWPRQEIVDVAYRGLGVLMGPTALNPYVHGTATYSPEELKLLPGYRSGAEREEDVAEAKRLLDAAGFTGWEGSIPTIQSTLSNLQDAFILRQDAFREIGFDITIRPEPYSNILVLLANRDFDILWTCQCANGLDPNEFLEFYFAPGAVRNYGEWENPRYTELLGKQNLEVDAEARNAIIREMVDIVDQDAPRPAGVQDRRPQVTQDYLHGWHQTYSSSFENAPDRIWTERT